MKATFVYSNGKTFTASNVVEDSIDIIRVKRKGLPPLVTAKYSQFKEVDGEQLTAVLNTLLHPNQAGRDNNITSGFSSVDLMFGIGGVMEYTIPATENGLVYIIITPQEYDDQFSPSCGVVGEASSKIKPLTVIPVIDETLPPGVLADCLALML